MKYDDAKSLLEKELNQAFLDGEMKVHVLHGIGEGILKKMTVETAESMNFTKVNETGTIPFNPGITVIDILTPDPSMIQKYMKS
ncbi:MAG: DNA mismatch repair protein MutS [Spirochaetia bacterium]|nr:DNA mismatch repair protein MutS [Spirochaetia bacterium]